MILADTFIKQPAGEEEQNGSGHYAEENDGHPGLAVNGLRRDGGNDPNGNNPGKENAHPKGIDSEWVTRKLKNGIKYPGEQVTGVPKHQGGKNEQDGIEDDYSGT